MNLDELINSYSGYLKRKYGRRHFRVGLSLGKPCPHRESTGGCHFCRPDTFTDSSHLYKLPLQEQVATILPRIQKGCGEVGLIAYLQDNTSTYGTVEELEKLYRYVMTLADFKELVISTRPDYIWTQLLQMLQSLPFPITLEVGVQTIHDKSLALLQRGHTQAENEQAIQLCEQYGIRTGVHLIMGIPVESQEEMMQTIQWVNAHRGIQEVKLHHLVVYEDTPLAKAGLVGPSIDAYLQILAEIIPALRPDLVLSRLFTSNLQRSGISRGSNGGSKFLWQNRLTALLQNSPQGVRY